MAIRGTTWAFFRDDCGACPWVNLCIRASAFSHGLRQYFLSLRGLVGKTTPAMEEGARLHAEEQERVGAVAVDEYGFEKFSSDLEAGEELVLREVPVCARGQGFRGDVDILHLRKVSDEPRYLIRIVELKRTFLKPYILQPVVYGLIFSDPTVEVVFRMPSLRSNRLKTVPKRIYPDKGPIFLDIDLIFQTLGGKGRVYIWPFMRDSEPTEWAKGMMMAVRRRAKVLRRFHKPGIYFLETLPYCPFCKKSENEECGFWEDVCSRIPYIPRSKFEPLFWGKKKLLVKTKPKVKLDAKVPF